MSEYDKYLCGSTSNGDVWFLPNYVINPDRLIAWLERCGVSYDIEDCTDGLIVCANNY